MELPTGSRGWETWCVSGSRLTADVTEGDGNYPIFNSIIENSNMQSWAAIYNHFHIDNFSFTR